MGTKPPSLSLLLSHRHIISKVLFDPRGTPGIRRLASSRFPLRSLQLGITTYVINVDPRISKPFQTDRATVDTPQRIDAPVLDRLVPRDQLNFVGLCGAQIVRNLLVQNGVQHAFAYPGGANMHLTDSICTDGRIKVFLPRHEQGGGHMAEGYARVTGRPGVVSVTSGPGATNMITPLQDAMSDGIPMIVIAGQVSAKDLGTGAFQDADIVGMAQPCTKWATMVECVEDLPAYVDEAFRVATSGRQGPVLLSIPQDVFKATWCADRLTVGSVLPPSSNTHVEPPPPLASVSSVPENLQDISEAARCINNSERPLIIAGAGILSSSAGPRLLSELAVRGNIPVATTLHGLGAFDEDHPLSLHMLGFHGSAYGNYAAQSADTIVVLGARLDERVTANLDGFAVAARTAGKRGRGGIIHFDIQPNRSDRVIDTHLSVVGDVTENLKILAPLIEPRVRATWLHQIRAWKTMFPLVYEPSSVGQRVKPQEVVKGLDRQTSAIKDRVIVTTGAGNHQMWAAQFFTWKQPRSLITSGGLAVCLLKSPVHPLF